MSGRRLGPYEVLATLGEGGMGQVYRARDTRLNRDVAIKAIHAEVARDPDRVARFEREAQLLASLNHPNIAAIHGIEEADGATYLVLEFVEGRPLSELLHQGALPVDEALRLARGIADALAAAHERGIIHRDLKPGNVMVTADGQAKVLDFGLGKALDASPSSGTGPQTANSPTMTLAATAAGIILGTAGYMSPEQAKGRAADRRSDVWAFGCVLFEMLAGRRAFAGDDITETLAAIVRGEPDWAALPDSTPPALRALVQRCLVKDRAQRLPDMSVVRFILNEPSSIGGAAPRLPAGTPEARAIRLPAVIGLVAAAILVTAGVAALWPRSAPRVGPVSRLTIVLPDGDEINEPLEAPLAMAPDGSAVAYTATRDGKAQLFVRTLADTEPRPLPGTEGGYSPFFRPDGRWIGFFATGKLKKITTAGTALQDLVQTPGNSAGGTWSADDTIYFAPTNISGLWKVSASGGPAVEVTKLDEGAGEISHRWPSMLEDGKSLLFSTWTGPGPDEHRIERLNLADGTRQVLVRNVEGPATVVGGYLIDGGRRDNPQALPWPAVRSDLTGLEPIGLPFASQTEGEGASAFAVSSGGTFAYLDATRPRNRLVWIDRTGRVEPVPIPERPYVLAGLSPDGRRAVLQISAGIKELWQYDFDSQTLTPFVTSGGSSQAPLWSADGRFVYYRGTRTGHRDLFRKAADGSGAEERMTTKADVVQTPASVTSDGKWLIFTEGGRGAVGALDIWKMSLGGTPAPVRIVATPALERFPRVSPDGHWLAYASDVSGRQEVWVQPFEGPGARRQVSRDGGVAPSWSHDGRELFFMAGNAMMAVSVSGTTFGAPHQLFTGHFAPSENGTTNYDVAADGRFLVIVPVRPPKPFTRIEVILNGLELLRRPGDGSR